MRTQSPHILLKLISVEIPFCNSPSFAAASRHIYIHASMALALAGHINRCGSNHSSVAKPASTINFWQLIHLILFFRQPLAISRHSPQKFIYLFVHIVFDVFIVVVVFCLQPSPVTTFYLFFFPSSSSLFSFCIPFYFRRWLYAQSYLPSFSVAFILHDVIKPFCW